MFVGHYSASFLGKAAEKKVPLWLLFLAVQFLDVLWTVFVLLGIEKVRIVPGITASSPLDLYYMPYTHSLVGALGWSALAFLGCQLVPRLKGLKTGAIVGGAVFSHWVLDLIVHRPDLALYGNHFKMGLGLWNYLWPAFLLEMCVLWAGAWFYARTLKRKAWLVGYVAILSVVQYAGTFQVSPPPGDRAEAVTALFCYVLFAALVAVVERLSQRQARAVAAGQ